MLSALVASRLCPMIGKVSSETGICVGHLATMHPALVACGRVESVLASPFSPLIFQKRLEFS
jgi:hypothetical protein